MATQVQGCIRHCKGSAYQVTSVRGGNGSTGPAEDDRQGAIGSGSLAQHYSNHNVCSTVVWRQLASQQSHVRHRCSAGALFLGTISQLFRSRQLCIAAVSTVSWGCRLWREREGWGSCYSKSHCMQSQPGAAQQLAGWQACDIWFRQSAILCK